MTTKRTSFKTPVPNSRAARHIRKILETPTAALLPPWSEPEWSDPSCYTTIRSADIDGDGKAEMVGRAAGGVELWWFDSVAATWTCLASAQCGWSDANGWTDVSRASTLRLADVNGDGICELVARNSGGIEVWQYSSAGASCQQLASAGCNWTDANDWNLPQYYSTIICADVNGDHIAEIIGRGPNGIEVWSCANGQWTQLSAGGCEWTDANQWNLAQYYMTVMAADVNGDGIPELIGRGPSGIEIWSFQSSQWTQLPTNADIFADPAWSVANLYATIRAADINGDGKAELIGRNTTGVDVWGMDQSGAWTQLGTGGCGLTDANNWNQPQYYSTLRMGDVNGDGKAELTARGPNGLVTFAWENNAWTELGTDGGIFTDSAGWTSVSCYSTLIMGDIDDTAACAMLGRSTAGMQAVLFNMAAGLWQATAPLLKVNSRFSQNYLMETPVPGGAEMATATNSNGDVELFVVGSGNNIYNIYPDPASDTGWNVADTGLNGFLVAAAQAPDGSMMLVAGDGSMLVVALRGVQPEAQWVVGTNLSAIGTLGRPSLANLNDSVYFAGLCVSGSDSSTFSTVTTVWAPGQSAPQPVTTTELGTLPAGTSACGSLCVDEASGSVSYTVFFSNGTVTAPQMLAGTVAPTVVKAISYANSGGNPLLALPPAWTTVHSVNGNTVQTILLTGGDQGLAYFYLNGVYQTVINDWAGSVGPQPELYLRRFVTVVNGVGEIELFGEGTASGHLFHSRYQTSGSWTPIVDLGQMVSGMASAVSQDGYGEFFGVNPANNSLVHCWQDTSEGGAADPEGGSLDWQTEEIEVESSGEIQLAMTYTTEITVVNSYGMPVPGSTVTINASELMLTIVNGAAAWIDFSRSAMATANAAGQVTVVTQTSSLSTPLLKVHTDQMPAGTLVVVEPNADVQSELQGITGPDLDDAFDAEGKPIVPGPYEDQKDQLASVIAQCMTLVAPREDSTSAPSAAVARRSARVAKSSAAITGIIDCAAVPEQHWRARVGGGRVTFERLTAGDAQQAIAAFPGIAGGFFGLPDWGDIWDSVRNAAGAVANVLDVIVSTVADGIQVAINFVSDTVSYAWNGLVSLVEQAFDIIEGVFESIGVVFQRIFEWLAFLFDWDDILTTKNAITYLVEQTFGVITGALSWVNGQVDSNIAIWQGEIANYCNQLADGIAGRTGVMSVLAQNRAESNAVDEAQSHNVMFTALVNSPPTLPPTSALAGLLADPSNPINIFVDNLNSQVQAIEDDPQSNFTAALADFQNMLSFLASNPMQALRDGMAGFIRLLGALATAALDLVKWVVDSIADVLASVVEAISGVLSEAWDIPFVSALYSYITSTDENPSGDPLSCLDLMALVAAIPGTVLYKAIMGDAPFADLAAFEERNTTAAILQRMGIGGSPASAEPSGNYSTEDSVAMACVSAVAAVIYGLSSGRIDGDPDGIMRPVTEPGFVLQTQLSFLNLTSEVIMNVVGSPLTAATPPTVMGLVTWSWMLLGNVLDGACCVVNQVMPEYLGAIPLCGTMMIGGGALILYAIGSIVDDQPAWTLLGNVAGVIPNGMKWFRLPSVFTEYPGLIAVLAWSDYICIPLSALSSLVSALIGAGVIQDSEPALLMHTTAV